MLLITLSSNIRKVNLGYDFKKIRVAVLGFYMLKCLMWVARKQNSAYEIWNVGGRNRQSWNSSRPPFLCGYTICNFIFSLVLQTLLFPSPCSQSWPISGGNRGPPVDFELLLLVYASRLVVLTRADVTVDQKHSEGTFPFTSLSSTSLLDWGWGHSTKNGRGKKGYVVFFLFI